MELCSAIIVCCDAGRRQLRLLAVAQGVWFVNVRVLMIDR